MDKFSPGLILLTYKGKVLLMHKQKSVIDEEKHPWSFIGAIKAKNKPFEVVLKRRVQEEMGIKINNITSISEFYFHATLTDENVNNIQRSEHQLLDFFSPKEVRKLFLSLSTQKFISKHALEPLTQN